LRLVGRGHQYGRAKLLEPGFGFCGGKRAAERGFLLIELCFEVGAEFGDDVVLPLPGQVLSYGFEVAIEKFHGVFLLPTACCWCWC
jgi:hypothetical protein